MPEQPRAALPPLEWLRVFDAAARLRSFTAAAFELGLTQAAVSQRIRNLEARLGASLFDRLPRGVELTSDGEAYAPHVRAALAGLQRSTEDLFGARRRMLTIAASASVIALWIVPRLAAVRGASPSAVVSLATVHRDADLLAAQADYEVRFGAGEWPGRRGAPLFPETLAPVAAPGLLGQRQAAWREAPQIALSGPRAGWLDWAAAAGAPPPAAPSLRFDSFHQARDAALAGAGVLLGSIHLLEPDLAAGSLVRLPEPAVTMPSGYWLTWDASGTAYKDHSALVRALCRPE